MHSSDEVLSPPDQMEGLQGLKMQSMPYKALKTYVPSFNQSLGSVCEDRWKYWAKIHFFNWGAAKTPHALPHKEKAAQPACLMAPRLGVGLRVGRL